MCMVTMNFQKTLDGRWYFWRRNDTPEQVVDTRVLMPLTLRHEIHTPQAMRISDKLLPALQSKESADYLFASNRELFQNMETETNAPPLCPYHAGGASGKHDTPIPRHTGARLEIKNGKWACPHCHFTRERSIA